MSVPNAASNSSSAKKTKYPPPPEFKGTPKVNIVEGFLYALQCYLDHYEIQGREAVMIGVGFLRGNAQDWWRLQTNFNDPKDEMYVDSFKEFASEIRNQYIPKIAKREAIQKLNNLRQTGSLKNYNEQFRHLLLQLPNYNNEDEKIHKYLEGLNAKIRLEVELKIDEDTSLSEVMQLAEIVDNIVSSISRRSTFSDNARSQTRSSQPRQNNDVTPMELDNLNGKSNGRNNSSNFNGKPKRLTANEREKLRRSGRCFSCKEFGHKFDDPICKMYQELQAHNMTNKGQTRTASTSTREESNSKNGDRKKKVNVMIMEDSDSE